MEYSQFSDLLLTDEPHIPDVQSPTWATLSHILSCLDSSVLPSLPAFEIHCSQVSLWPESLLCCPYLGQVPWAFCVCPFCPLAFSPWHPHGCPRIAAILHTHVITSPGFSGCCCFCQKCPLSTKVLCCPVPTVLSSHSLLPLRDLVPQCPNTAHAALRMPLPGAPSLGCISC